MKVQLTGTGGPDGWPMSGCGCASCGRVSVPRRPLSVVVDDNVRLTRHELGRTDDGDTVVGPDGGRLLFANGTGGTATGEPYDLVLLDPLERPERLGSLRRRGLVSPATQVVAIGVDHRVPSEAELARRLGFWGMVAVPDGTTLDTGSRAEPVAFPRRTLLLGGSGSGKSGEAELRLAAEPSVTYVATAAAQESMRERIQTHRSRRPAHWETVETTDLAGILDASSGVLLIDSLTTWAARVFDETGSWEDGDRSRVREGCDVLLTAWRRTRARVVLVSDEVGMGVVPASASGRVFRDVLGELNQRIAAESEDVALVVAGRVLGLSA